MITKIPKIPWFKLGFCLRTAYLPQYKSQRVTKACRDGKVNIGLQLDMKSTWSESILVD